MEQQGRVQGDSKGVGGLTGWLLARMRRTPKEKRKLILLERITLAPRQSLALIEADGQRLLVATGTEGGTAIYSLDRKMPAQGGMRSIAAKHAGRTSW